MEREKRLKAQEDLRETRKIKILLAIIVILLVVVVSSIIIYIRSTNPMTQAEKEAIEIAQKSANLTSVNEFYSFNRKESYFSVTGKDKDGNELVVIIPQAGEKVTVLNQKDGMSEEQIRQVIATDYSNEKIQKISLGMFNDQPAWEIATKNAKGNLSYYVLSFEKAEELSAIRDI